jgi:hypothetical protein
MFNRLAGSADEMASFIWLLKQELARQKSETSEQVRLRDEAIKELERLKNEREVDSQERTRLQDIIDQLSLSRANGLSKAQSLLNMYSGSVFEHTLEAKLAAAQEAGFRSISLSPLANQSVVVCAGCKLVLQSGANPHAPVMRPNCLRPTLTGT